MANESAFKSYSLTDRERSADLTDNEAPKIKASFTSNIPTRLKAISSKPSEPKLTRRPKFNWDGILNQSYLLMFTQQDDPLMGSGGYDYVFHIGTHRIYMLVEHQNLDVTSLKIPKQAVRMIRQQAAAKLTKRFQQLRNKHPLSSVIYEDEEVESIHYVGLTSLTAQYEEKIYPIEHSYGSVFFQEDCVLDLDDDSQVIQLYSLDSFIKIMSLLQTPSDLLSFFEFHLESLISLVSYPNEQALAEAFLESPFFFQRAFDVQTKLVEIGLLAKVESRLEAVSKPVATKLIGDKKAQALKAELIKTLHSSSHMFQKLLNGVAKRQHESGATIPADQMKTLVEESMYTRMSIMEEIIAYDQSTPEERSEGYLCHQHSYNQFGHHYVLIIYGLDEDAEFSRKSIQHSYNQLLMDINSQLQDPVMDEYFILGFDMSDRDDRGNVSVKMDVYHQSGSAMTVMERRLYEQVQELSSYQTH